MILQLSDLWWLGLAASLTSGLWARRRDPDLVRVVSALPLVLVGAFMASFVGTCKTQVVVKLHARQQHPPGRRALRGTDLWGRQVQLSWPADGRTCRITAAGFDGIFGTSDDRWARCRRRR